MNPLGIAVILGIVEGLTEFIPVSSTGHLIVAASLLGFAGEKASTFEVFIQSGAILSVVVLYWRRFLTLVPRRQSSLQYSSSMRGWAGLWRMGVATVPALVAGYLAHGAIKNHLFNPQTVAIALVVGGLGILLAEKLLHDSSDSLDSLTLLQALGIGVFQVLSLWPGISRSAATIVGGLVVGLNRKGAAEFSFLIAVPVMLAATAYDLLKMRESLSADDWIVFGVGFLVSFVVGVIAIAGFVRILNRWTLAPFAWYRILAAPVFYWLTQP
jgi:undecaprenyl-diphosphatase